MRALNGWKGASTAHVQYDTMAWLVGATPQKMIFSQNGVYKMAYERLNCIKHI